MSDRYSKILSIDSAKWVIDCPVILKKGALLHDNVSDRNLLQLKFQSIINKVIIAIELQYKAYSIGNELLTEDKFSYLDLNIGMNEEFGEKVPIFIHNNARNFSFTVCKVFFSDETVWESSETLEDISQQDSIQANLQNLTQQFQREYQRYTKKNKEALFVPVVKDNHWQCTCGALNLGSFGVCRVCGISKENLIKISDENYLSEQNVKYEKSEKERIEKEAKEREERQIRDAAEKAEKRKKQKRIIRISSISAAGLLLIFFMVYISIYVIIPNSRYSSARKDFNAGKYELAIEKFEKLDGYKDSLNQLIESKYCMAKEYYDSQEYENALSYFTELNDYKDSAEYISPCENYVQYGHAKELAENSKYKEALDSLSSLPEDFEDIDALKIEYATMAGETYFHEKNYDEAIKIFEKYHIDNDLLKESYYQKAILCEMDEDYSIAITYFEKCGDYKESKTYLASCKTGIDYSNAIGYMDNGRLEEAISMYNELGNYKKSKEYKAMCQKYKHYCGVWKCVAYTYTSPKGKSTSYNKDEDTNHENMDCVVQISKEGKATFYFDGNPVELNGSVATWHLYGKSEEGNWKDTNTLNLETGARSNQFYHDDGSKSAIYVYQYEVK